MQSCTFIGHHDSSCYLKEKISSTVETLICEHNVRIFFVGTHGIFDKLVYSILCSFEKKYDIKIVVVLAYLNAKENEMYDEEKTVFPIQVSTTPKRYSIIKRNEYMISCSDYLVCYVNHKFSNSYKFVELAKKRKLRIINVGDLNI